MPKSDLIVELFNEGRLLFDKKSTEVAIKQLELYEAKMSKLITEMEDTLTIARKLQKEALHRIPEMKEDVRLMELKEHEEKYDAPSSCSAPRTWGNPNPWVTPSTSNKDKGKEVQTPIGVPHQKDTVVAKLGSDFGTVYKTLNLAGLTFTLPVVQQLSDLRPSFAWNEGHDGSKPGIYTSLDANFYVEVPLSNVNDHTMGPSAWDSTIPCKYLDFETCQSRRQFLSNKYSTPMKECRFAHYGQKLNRITLSARCPAMPSLGSLDTLKYDLKKLAPKDMRSVLLYGLSDALTGAIWHQHANLRDEDPLIMENLDVCC